MGGSIASFFVDIGAETKSFESGLSRVSAGLTGFASKASGLAGSAAMGFGFAVAAPVLAGLGGVFQSVTSGVMDTNAALEAGGVSWGVLLGSADKAEAKLTQLFDFGATTPFEFGEVDKASRLLETFGGAALNTMPNLTMIGDAASATGYRFQDVAFWTARMYDSMQNGQPLGEPMMNLQQMGVISGETRNMIEKMQKEGAKGPEIWAAYAASQARFTGMMEQQSTTFSGRLSTMKDSLDMLLAQAGKPIFDAFSAGLGRFNNLLASPGLANFVSLVAGGLASAFSSVASFVGTAFTKVQAFGGLLNAVFVGFQTGNFNGVFGPILDSLNGLSDGLGTKLAGAVNTALNLFQVARDSFLTFVAALTGDWGGQFDTRINGTVKAFGNLGLTIHTIAEWFTGTALPAAQSFFTWLQSAFTTIMSVVGPFLAGFGSVIALVGLGGVAFGALAAIAMPIITGLVTAVGFLLSPIGLIAVAVGLLAAAWVNNWGNIQGITQTVWTALQTGAATVLPYLQQGFALVSTAISAALPYVISFGQSIMSAIQTVLPVLQQFGAAIMAGIGGAIQAIVPLAQQFFAAFQSSLPALQGLWQQLISVWNSAVAALQALAPVGQLIAGILGGVLITAIGVLMGAVGGIISLFTGGLPGAITFVSGMLTALGGVFDLVASLVTGMVGIVSNVLQGNWSAAWQSAQSMVTGAASAIQQIFSGLGTAVVGIVQSMVGAVLGFVSGFVSTITGYFTALTADSTNQVSQLVSTVVSWFQQLPGRVSEAMAGLLSAISSALANALTSAAAGAAAIGNAIIDGIKGAISAGAGALRDAIGGVVGGLIDGAKGILGIHSPSKVFHEIGQFTMLGFANGIDAEKDKPKAEAVKAIADAVKAAVDALGALKNFRAPDAAVVQAFKAALTDLTTAFVDAAKGFKEDALKAAGVFADAAGKAADTVSKGVAAFALLPKFVKPMEDAAADFAEALTWLVLSFAESAATFTDEALQSAQLFSETAGKAVDVIGKGVDGLSKLIDFKRPTNEAIGEFKFAVEWLVRSFGDSAQMFSTDFLAAAGFFADVAKAGVAVLADGIDGLAKLADFKRPTDDAIGAFKFAVEWLVRSLADSAAMFNVETLKAAQDFAESGGKALGILSQGIEGLTGLITFVAPTKAAIDAFAWAALYVVQKFGEMASHLATEGLKACTDFSTAAGAALGATKTGIDAFLAMKDLSVPSSKAIDALLTAIQYVVTRVGEVGAAMQGEGLVRAQAFASAASLVFGALKAALDVLSAVEKFKDGPTKALDELVKGMDEALARMDGLETQSIAYLAAAQRFRDNMQRASLAINTGMGAAGAGAGMSLAVEAGASPTSLAGGGSTVNATVNVYGSLLAEADLQDAIVQHVSDAQRSGRLS